MRPARRWWLLALVVGGALGALALWWRPNAAEVPDSVAPPAREVRTTPAPAPIAAPPEPAESPRDPELSRRQFDAAVRVARALEPDVDPELLSTMCAESGRRCLHRAPLTGTWTEDDVRAAITALPAADRPTLGVVYVEPRPLGGTVVTYELRLEE